MLSATRYLKDFIYLLYPDVCASCGNSLVEGEKFICLQCEYDLPKTDFHLHRDNAIENHLAGRVVFERAAAYYFFTDESKVQHVIHNIKYAGNKDLAVYIGKQYGMDLKESGFMDGVDMIVPVPLHSSRLKKRGFNQSDLFAKGLNNATGIPVNTAALKRLIANPTQTKKSRIARWENVESIFEVTDKNLLKNKHVLLVDDVITTGATLEACAMQVLKCENAKVSIVTMACA
jgi:ComF family protein